MSFYPSILVVMDSLFTGGAEYSTLLWIEWLQQKGYKVQLVLLKPKTPSYNIADFNIDPDSVILLQTEGAWNRYRELKRILNSFRPDLVHSVLNASNFNTRVLRLLQGGFKHLESVVNQPYSRERLQDQSLSTIKIRLLQWFDRLTQKRGVQHFHANSRAVAAHYQQAVHVPAAKITVIPRGRESNPFLPERRLYNQQYKAALQIPDNHLLLINTGRHEYQKAHDVLLTALSLLQSKVPFTLLIAGREGKETQTLKQLIEQLQLQDRVRLLGHRTDIPQLLAASDLFVFPSRYEGMPGALIEACAAGLPVVCTNLPCMTEVVQANGNALLFPLNDAEALAQQLEQLLSNSELRSKMGVESLTIFQQNFTLESIHLQMEALIQQMAFK